MDKSKIKIAFLSTYPPRECGIATFAKSFVRIFDELYVRNQTKVIAVSDEMGKYDYSRRVGFEIDQFDEQSYVKAAEYVNQSSIEVVSLQHEYGIFGGLDGKYIIKFLESVNKPVVTSFHSVLKEHSDHRYKLTQRILDLSDSIVVMTNDAKKILTETFKINPRKIKIVPHGVPNVRYDDKDKAKSALGLKGKTVLSTFGLINKGKGIENAISAMSLVAKDHPNIIYLVIGATHPTVLKNEGESYRSSLEELTKKYDLQNNVRFINKYLDYKELVEYLKATDIYLAPQVDFNQAFSGTLSYAIGCANAVVSSPTHYAKEILASGRGIVTMPEAEKLAKEIDHLLASKGFFDKTRMNAYRFARNMVWPQVGLLYLKVIESNLFIKKDNWKKRVPSFSEKPSLKYLEKMTDKFGIVQHAKLTEPNYDFGYSLDDQARGIIAGVNYIERYGKNESVQSMITIYLDYLKKVIDKNGIIHNFIDKKFKFADKIASNDSIGRSFWALATIVKSKVVPNEIKNHAKELLPIYKQKVTNNFVKAIAYNLLGFCLLEDKDEINRLADILVQRFEENSDGDKWRWFEGKLTYANGIVPYALLKAYVVTKNKKYLKVAQDATVFLDSACCYKGIISPIGQDGWYSKNSKKAIYDQQSLEAADMALLYNEFAKVLKDKRYRNKAIEWFGWFFGNNINESVMYDNVTRGIYDGMTRKGVNGNQGAESILVYLMAYLSFDD